jgi:hypothetical protein
LSVFNPTTGDVEVIGVALDTDELPVHLNSRNAGGAGTHERIKNAFGLGDKTDAPSHNCNRLFSRMIDLLAVLCGSFETMPKMICEPSGAKNVSPCQFAFRHIETSYSARFIPTEPTVAVGQSRCVIVGAPKDRGLIYEWSWVERGIVAVDRFELSAVMSARILVMLSSATRLWLVPNPVRWVRNDGIDLAERRQDFSAIPQIQGSVTDDLDPAHLPTPSNPSAMTSAQAVSHARVSPPVAAIREGAPLLTLRAE